MRATIQASAPKPIRVLQRNIAPERLAREYLYDEFLKIFQDVHDPAFRKAVRRSLNAFVRRDGLQSFWQLVAAVAEGWKLKTVFRYLSDSAYQWNLEEHWIENLTMTGFSPDAVDRVIRQCHRRFFEFAEYYRSHPAFFRKYMPRLKPQPERDRHPVLIYYDTRLKQLRLFDGMRQTTLAAIAGKDRIRAYVGYPIRPGKPKVNQDKIWFFRDLLADSPKDQKTLQAFITVGQAIVRRTQNGRKVFRASLKPWSDPKIQQVIRAVVR